MVYFNEYTCTVYTTYFRHGAAKKFLASKGAAKKRLKTYGLDKKICRFLAQLPLFSTPSSRNGIEKNPLFDNIRGGIKIKLNCANSSITSPKF